MNITAEAYDECSEVRTAPRLSVKERKSTLVIDNPRNIEILRVKVDGCLPIETAKCDYLFEIPELARAYYVELKGRDVKHALEQILATVRHHFFATRHANYEKRGIIVSSRVPTITPGVQRLLKQCRSVLRHLEIKTTKYEVVVK